MFTAGNTQQTVLQSVQGKLVRLRAALDDVKELQDWAAGVLQSDLVSLGFSASDANTILGAAADANALNDYWTQGHASTNTYPQPATTPYALNTNAKQLLGP